MPEVLQDAGVSWKVYNPSGSRLHAPELPDAMLLCKNVLMYFEQFRKRPKHKLHHLAFSFHGPSIPNDYIFTVQAPTTSPMM